MMILCLDARIERTNMISKKIQDKVRLSQFMEYLSKNWLKNFRGPRFNLINMVAPTVIKQSIYFKCVILISLNKILKKQSRRRKI